MFITARKDNKEHYSLHTTFITHVIKATHFSYAYVAITRLKTGPCIKQYNNTIQYNKDVGTRLRLYCIAFDSFLIQGPTFSLMMDGYICTAETCSCFCNYDKSCVQTVILFSSSLHTYI